jgi:dihydroxyacetone kinase-like predicted kinase
MRSYLLEFVIVDPGATACAVRQQLRKTLNWSRELLVVGDERALTVHVRTPRPDLALGIGWQCGAVDDIVLKADAPAIRVA